MALTNTDKTEIERIVRKEIKSFLGSNTIQQYENKIVDKIKIFLNFIFFVQQLNLTDELLTIISLKSTK